MIVEAENTPMGQKNVVYKDLKNEVSILIQDAKKDSHSILWTQEGRIWLAENPISNPIYYAQCIQEAWQNAAEARKADPVYAVNRFCEIHRLFEIITGLSTSTFSFMMQSLERGDKNVLIEPSSEMVIFTCKDAATDLIQLLPGIISLHSGGKQISRTVGYM